MRKWKILEMAYSERHGKMIPTKISDDYGRIWEWDESDAVYWRTDYYFTFGFMIQKLDEAGLIVREAFNENAR